MTERTTTAKVIFRKPADIGGLTELLPAGEYVVETDEELIHGLSVLAYRRLRTDITVPAQVGASRGRHMIEIGPESLAAALARDSAVDTRVGL